MDNITRLVFDGAKAVNLQTVPQAWDPYIPEESSDVRERVAWIARAEALRVGAVSSVPFEIRRGETVVTSSQDYEDPTGFLPNPRRFLQLIESALCNYGCAYFWRGKNRAGYQKELKYFVPPSIEPDIDPLKGLVGFKRRVGTLSYDYKLEEVLYFWPADGNVEVGPPTVWPAKSAQEAGEVLKSTDEFAAKFFERGAVRATLLGVPRSTPANERERVESWFNRFVGGIKNAFAVKTFNAEDVKPVIIGDGIDGLSDTTLTREKKEDIAAAYSIPFAIFFSDAANYATAQQDWRQWYDTSIVPECEFIAGVLNEQIFEPMGLQWEFVPETLDFYQEDESSRASGLQSIVNAGVPLLTAMEILGFELTDEQRAAIEEAMEEPEPEPEPALPEQPVSPSGESEPEAEDEEDEDEQVKTELARWKRKAVRLGLKRKTDALTFESDILPASVVAQVRERLEAADSLEDIKAAFVYTAEPDIQDTGREYSDLGALIAEMKRANDLLERSIEPVQG